MADQAIPPKPPEGQLVDEKHLYQALMGSRVDTTSYTGTDRPGMLWQLMVRGDGSAIPYYRELEDKDDDVSSALDELKLSVLERNWDVQPGDESQAALDAAAFAKQQLNGIDFDSVMDSQLDAAPYGYSIGELMFDSSAGQAALLSIDDCPQELFIFGPRYQPQIGQMQLLPTIYSMDGQLVDEVKFATFSYRGRARSRTGRPLLMRAFWPSWFKRRILGLWLKTAAKSNGTAIARYADSASPAQQQEAVAAAEAILDSTAAAIPVNMQIEIELLKATQNRSPDMFEKLFTQMQYAIARAIKGETLTSFGGEGGVGSKGQGQAHANTFEKRSISLAKKSSSVINQQVLKPLHLWNYGPNVPGPVFAWDTAEEEDLTRDLERIEGGQKVGLSIGANWGRKLLKIPQPDKDEPILQPNSTLQVAPLPNAAFTEGTQDLFTQQLNQFDDVYAQLRKQSIKLLAERTEEIVDVGRQGR